MTGALMEASNSSVGTLRLSHWKGLHTLHCSLPYSETVPALRLRHALVVDGGLLIEQVIAQANIFFKMKHFSLILIFFLI